MNLFLDSSALLKIYLNEKGSEEAEKWVGKADMIFVSAITHIECASAFQRLFYTKYIDKKQYQDLNQEISFDFPFFKIVDLGEEVEFVALKILEQYQMRSLDAIQLASLLFAGDEVQSFLVCDQKLKKYAIKEGIHVIDPTI